MFTTESAPPRKGPARQNEKGGQCKETQGKTEPESFAQDKEWQLRGKASQGDAMQARAAKRSANHAKTKQITTLPTH